MNKLTRWLNMIDPRVFIGKPLQFKPGIMVYPPTIGEVIANPRFGQYLRLFTITQDDIRDEMNKNGEYVNIPSPFEFLMANAYNSSLFLEVVQEAFRFFIHEEVVLLYEEKKILIGSIENAVKNASSLQELVMIEEAEYFDFQNCVRLSIGQNSEKPPEPINPREDPRVARIKAKARERDRIKAKKGTAGGISLSTSLVAICCMGVGVSPLNIGEMSYASLTPIMSMVQNREKYDMDVRSLLAGADSKKIKPKYWIRDLDEK